MDGDEIKWREGRPDYTKNNIKYLRERTQNHASGSIEETVQNLVKTWEMEASHKLDLKDWKTIDPENYLISANGCQRFKAQEALKNGNYSNLMQDTAPYYDATK